MFSDRGAAPGITDADDLPLDPFAAPAVGIALSDPPDVTSKGAHLTEPEEDTAPEKSVAPLRSPLHKRKWFRIASVIGLLLGIALLFIILFPVLKAVVQYVVNRSQLDITTAAITNPSNTS